MKLYLLTTQNLGSFYIVAKTATIAEETLLSELNKADYGFTTQRNVENIQILSSEMEEWSKGILNFSSNNRLMIVK